MEHPTFSQIFQHPPVNQIAEKLNHLNMFLQHKQKGIKIYQIMNFIEQSKWELVKSDADLNMINRELGLINQIKKQIRRKTNYQFILDKKDASKIFQFMNFIQKLNKYSQNSIFKLIKQAIVNQQLVGQIMKYLKKLNSTFHQVSAVTQQVYSNKDILQILILEYEKNNGKFQRNGLNKYLGQFFKLKTKQSFSNLSTYEFVEIYFAGTQNIPQIFIVRFTQELSKQIKTYRQLVLEIKKLIIKVKQKRNYGMTKVQKCFSYIFDRVRKHKQLKIQISDFDSVVFNNLWQQYSQLSVFPQILKSFQKAFLQILDSELQQDRKKSDLLYQSYQSNLNSFSLKNFQRLRMRQCFQSNFKYNKFYKSKLNQIGQLKRYLLQYFTREGLSRTFFDKNQKAFCINARNKQIIKLYKQFKQQIQQEKFTEQQLIKVSANCKLEDEINQGLEKQYQLHLSKYTHEVKQIQVLTNQKLKLISNMQVFLSKLKDINIILKQRLICHKNQVIQTEEQKLNTEKIKNKITEILQNIEKIKSIVNDNTLRNIFSNLNELGLKEIQQNFNILECFYVSQVYFKLFINAQGVMLPSIRQFQKIFKQNIILKINQKQLSLEQVKDLILKPSQANLKQFLNSNKICNKISIRNIHILLDFNRINPQTEHISQVMKQALYFKINISSEQIDSSVIRKIRNLCSEYDNLVDIMKNGVFDIQNLWQLCRLYLILKQILKQFKMEFILDYKQKINLNYIYLKDLIVDILSLSKLEEGKLLTQLKNMLSTEQTKKINQSSEQNNITSDNHDHLHSDEIVKKDIQKFIQFVNRVSQIKNQSNPFQKLIKQKVSFDIQEQEYSSYSVKFNQILQKAQQNILQRQINSLDKIFSQINAQFENTVIRLAKQQKKKEQEQMQKQKNRRDLQRVSIIFEDQAQNPNHQLNTIQQRLPNNNSIIMQQQNIPDQPKGQQITQLIKQVTITYFQSQQSNSQEQQQKNLQQIEKLSYSTGELQIALKQFAGQNNQSLHCQINNINNKIIVNQNDQHKFVIIFYILLKLIVKKKLKRLNQNRQNHGVVDQNGRNQLKKALFKIECRFVANQCLKRLFDEYFTIKLDQYSQIRSVNLTQIVQDQPIDLINQVFNRINQIKNHQIVQINQPHQYRIYFEVEK